MAADQIITIVCTIAAVAFGYGILNQKVKTLEKKVSEIDDLRCEIKSINSTLQRLVGMFEAYMGIEK